MGLLSYRRPLPPAETKKRRQSTTLVLSANIRVDQPGSDGMYFEPSYSRPTTIINPVISNTGFGGSGGSGIRYDSGGTRSDLIIVGGIVENTLADGITVSNQLVDGGRVEISDILVRDSGI